MTEAQLARITKNLTDIAGIPGDIEYHDNAIWYFGCELAVLRLSHKYRDCTNADHGFSPTLNTHYFMLDISL
jgi:hypothetical protein